MNYNFTNSVRLALHRAREEAVRLKHDAVAPEHIFLALCHDEEVGAMMRHYGADAEEIRAAVEARLPVGDSRATVPELPYTSRGKKALEYSMAEARKRGDGSIRTVHLLVAAVRAGSPVASEVLGRAGVTLPRVRSWTPSSRREPSSRPESSFRVRIDDASDRSIYEQIVAQITEAVATGALRPGERLPTVRQQADALDVAPGTVARAYGELERQGVVVTEGARGTRVADRRSALVSDGERPATLEGLLRPVAVAAFHLGASAAELRAALEAAMRGIFDKRDHAA